MDHRFISEVGVDTGVIDCCCASVITVNTLSSIGKGIEQRRRLNRIKKFRNAGRFKQKYLVDKRRIVTDIMKDCVQLKRKESSIRYATGIFGGDKMGKWLIETTTEKMKFLWRLTMLMVIAKEAKTRTRLMVIAKEAKTRTMTVGEKMEMN